MSGFDEPTALLYVPATREQVPREDPIE